MTIPNEKYYRIMWRGLAYAYDDWSPLADLYSAVRYYLGSGYADTPSILKPMIKEIIERGYVKPGTVSDTFHPLEKTNEESIRLLQEYIDDNPSFDDIPYGYWFTVTPLGVRELERFWEEHDDEAD